MGGNPFAGGHRQGPFTWSYTTSGQNPTGDFDFSDPFEIFEQFFGGGFGQQVQRRPRYSLHIDFFEAIRGVTKEVTIEGKKHTIKVPAGANDGTRLRFDNFDITIDVGSHAHFKREGNDLFIDHSISFTLAALGGTTEVKTVDNTLKLKIRPGTASHTMVRLRGEGVPHLQRGGKGDLYVRLIVAVPDKLNRDQQRVLKELQNLGI